MQKYILVNPTTINGRTYHQLKAIRNNGKISYGTLGGWVSDEDCLSQEGECWIYPRAVVTDSQVFGNSKIFYGAQVTDSIIRTTVYVGNNSIITNCQLSSPADMMGSTVPNTTIADKTLKWFGYVDDRIVNTDYFQIYQRGNIIVLCGTWHCKVGCLTLTYLDAWQAIHYENDILTNFLKTDLKYSARYAEPDNMAWLKTICAKELKRLNIKIEEGN